MYACNGAEQPAGANPPPVRRAAAAHTYAYPAPSVFINPRYVHIYKSEVGCRPFAGVQGLVGCVAVAGRDGARGCAGPGSWHSPAAIPPWASSPRVACTVLEKTLRDTCSPLGSSSLLKV